MAWRIALAGDIIGIFIFVLALFNSDEYGKSFETEIAIAFAVIPYCLARAISEIEPESHE